MLTSAISMLILAKFQGGYTWATYASSGGKYTVDMPGKVGTMVRPVPTDAGTIQMYSAYVDLGQKAFMIMHNDYPKEGDSAKVLAGVWSGQTSGKEDLKVLRKTSLKWQGIPAMEGEFDYGTGANVTHSRVRFVLKGKRLYQQMVIGIGSSVDRAAADRFFKTFKIS
ncbi:MAG: hypothetical protein IT203_05925 [Fimbriimonadaceae bacterium]|nr:hypothetical protein [Fimbriimonadaceae bacterium]